MAEEVDYDELNTLAEELKEKIDPFYTKHVVVDGILVTGSDKVSERALREVGYAGLLNFEIPGENRCPLPVRMAKLDYFAAVIPHLLGEA